MSQSGNQTDRQPVVQYNYEIQCSGVSRDTVSNIEDLVNDNGIRTENFAFTHREESTTHSPMLRIKGLEMSTAENIAKLLRENNITEIVGESVVICLLPTETN